MTDACSLGGAIAQMGERVNGIHEVGGSIPPGSTNKPITTEIISLNDFVDVLQGCPVNARAGQYGKSFRHTQRECLRQF
jgi:hypothetical protein